MAPSRFIKVPLIIQAPGTAVGQRMGVNGSLVELATNGQPPALVDHCDGHSLCALLNGSDPGWVDEAPIDFTGEGVYAPAPILRQGRWQYVCCEGDAGMLFDLQQAPSELNKLCTETA